MKALLVLVIVLPPLLLLVGIVLGTVAAYWCWARRWAAEALVGAAEKGDVERGTLTTAAPSASTVTTMALLPCHKESQGRPNSIHIVASSCSLPLPSGSEPSSTDAGPPLGLLHLASASASSPLAHRLAWTRPPPLHASDPMQPDHADRNSDDTEQRATAAAPTLGAQRHQARLASLASLDSLGPGNSGSMSTLAGMDHRKTVSLDLGQLVRAGPAIINQVMEDWEARSTLYRIMSMDAGSGTAACSSPHAAAAAAAAGLLSPAAAALFTSGRHGGGGADSSGKGSGGGGGGGAMPKGEVHMDEIDLIECIGKGGYGCVYKASWRGAGVAVKYIVCPTDDSDSLGRAIREVVLSRKMSHPNVVQCYSWTVLTENEGQGQCRTPGSCSGLSSPCDHSFTGGRQRYLRQLAAGGAGGTHSRRTSLDLLRQGPGSARRGLDQRFSAAAAPSSNSTPLSPTSLALHRITEHPLQEGCDTMQQETEAPLWLLATPAASAGGAEAGRGHSSARPRPTMDSLVEELVAEAAEEQGQVGEQQQQQDGTSCSSASQQQSPEAVGAAPGGIAKPLLKLALGPANSRSPSGSPGIQAVHLGQPHLSDAEATAAVTGGEEGVDDVGQQQAAGGSNVATGVTFVTAPFATMDAEAQLPRQSTSDSGSGIQRSLWVLQGAGGAAGTLAGPRQQSTSEGEEGEDVYARFGSYEEMVAYFQSLAIEGQAQQHQRPGLMAAATSMDTSRSGSGQLVNEFNMTAASSFSDVLSTSGFMLEGSCSGLELSLLASQPSSPSHYQQQRPTLGSWLPPSSAASSRPITPKAGSGSNSAAAAMNNFKRLSRAGPLASGLAVQQQRQQPLGTSVLSLEMALAASMPRPAWWQADANKGKAGEGRPLGAAPTAAATLVASLSGESTVPRPEALSAAAEAEDQRRVSSCSSRDLPTTESSAVVRSLLGGLHCSSTISLNAWQAAAGTSAAVTHGSSLDLQRRPGSGSRGGSPDLQGQLRISSGSSLGPQGGKVGSCSSSVDTQFRGSSRAPLPASDAGDGRSASASSIGQAQQPLHVQPRPQLSLGAASGSGSVTPCLGSLSSPAAVAAADSLTVTPRQQSIRSKCAPSGLLRVEELRAEAAAALSGGCCEGARTSADRLSLGSHNDSFNSEEGFGSPVKQRRGGVKDVFLLEELALSGQEALMVVVMECCDLGSLRKALKRKAFCPNAKWPFQTTYRALLRTAQEIAKGMGYIHEFNIVHGDLKPGNVLLKTHKVDRRGYIAKVSDFGLSRALDFEDTFASLEATLGTIAYTAPETFTLNSLKKPADVYAFGVMLWEMFYCRDPYEGLMDGQICVGVTDGNLRPEFDADCPEPYRSLAERCWHQDPKRRPSFQEVDAELVRIEMEFRLACHRTATNSKRVSSTSAGCGSAQSSRAGSPEGSTGAGPAVPSGGADRLNGPSGLPK